MKRILIVLLIIGGYMGCAVPLPGENIEIERIHLAQTILGEARGEPWEAKLGVGHTIMNRMEAKRKYFGYTIPEIVTKMRTVRGVPHYQFSCWNKRDVNYKVIQEPLVYEVKDVWVECYTAAYLVLKGKVRDNTGGAMWYVDKSIINKPPSWTKELEQVICYGKLYFFRERELS